MLKCFEIEDPSSIYRWEYPWLISWSEIQTPWGINYLAFIFNNEYSFDDLWIENYTWCVSITIKTKFDYKLGCSLRLQLPFKKINIATYFENLIIRLHVLYALNTHFRFVQSDVIYYMIHELFFMHNFILQNLAIWKINRLLIFDFLEILQAWRI